MRAKKIFAFILLFSIVTIPISFVHAQISCTKSADANGDGIVNSTDFFIWIGNYSRLLTGKANGDFNCEGKVNVLDFGLLAKQYRFVLPSTSPSIRPSVNPSPVAGDGIWVSQAEILRQPTSGSAWQAMYDIAKGNLGTADVSDQDSNHDTNTLAAALVCVRTQEFCDKARAAIVSAINTESGGRWLAVGRNLTSYVIAADVLNLRSDGNPNSDGSKIEAWIESFLTKTLQHNNDPGRQVPFPVFESGSNASAQQGAAYTSVGAYLGNTEALDYAWSRFRLYACDPQVPHPGDINIQNGIDGGWSHDPSRACAVNPKSTTKEGHRIDGAIINDMVRGGNFQWPPVYTSYPWVGIEGFVPCAYILYRAGYPALETADRAVLRSLEYLKYLKDNTGNVDWFDGSRDNEIIHLVNKLYGTALPVDYPTGGGRTVGFTDWTHPL